MALKSLRLSPGELQTLLGEFTDDRKPPEFPPGTQLHLTDEVIKKLEMEDIPEVGTTMTLTAKVEVKSAMVKEEEGRPQRKHIELQITDMELSKDGKNQRDQQAEKLFGQVKDPATRAGNIVEVQDS